MKRLIYCLDGTWNTDDVAATATNVAKIHQAIAPTGNDGVVQISHYFDGIASSEGLRAKFLLGAVGYGVSDRIRAAYAKLMADYEPGDEIYLFGFSRGAFEARSLAGLLSLVGIGRADASFDLEKAWSLYRTPEAKRDAGALAALRGAAHYPARIKCIGVWDTVGNIGNPIFSGSAAARRQKFHDTNWSNVAETGLHALSIDETRGPFRPMLWTLPEGSSLPADQHVEQVWFAGTHADVGGGWRESGLSDVTLKWMAGRVSSRYGLTLDEKVLASTAYPDPLGPQHASATGLAFIFSRLVPFIRLVKQATGAIPAIRRALLGTWRTGAIKRSRVSINESVDASVHQRLGEKVIELNNGRSRMITYRPRALADIPHTVSEATANDGQPRHVKIFTVHGTFANETTWDNWDEKDDAARPAETRSFINRLSDKLREQGLILEPGDHSEYNWSGGNSHDERRAGAIGLKKHIVGVMAEDEKAHGPNYYDGAYVISHSHGGTISRMAMNMWDKPDNYYDPLKTESYDEFKNDDTCQNCKRSRNGSVGHGTVARPNGVITFGSPFVTFEPRKGGLLTAWLGAWVFRAFALAFVAIVGLLAFKNADEILQFPVPDFVVSILRLVWPVLIAWLLASFLPSLILPPVERYYGKGSVLFSVNGLFSAIRIVALLLLAAYFAAFVQGWWSESGGWIQATKWLPFVENQALQTYLAWFTIIGLSWLIVITLPGRVLRWLKRDVAPLGSRLSVKYDPSEDRAVKYLSYHTPGDEAGFGLRFFGFLTWLIQTLGLAFACMLALGVLLIGVIAVDGIVHLLFGRGLLSPFGISAFSDDLNERDRFIALIDGLTYLPRQVSSYFGVSGFEVLRTMPDAHNVAWWVPMSIVLSLFLMFLLLMPVMLVLLAGAYLTAMWLRKSGFVFGGEGMAWNIANRIRVTRRPNANTAMRVMLLSPEAWWRKEIAHCYYYKSDRVITDLANSIAGWRKLEPTFSLPIGRWIGATASWAVVIITMLGIFPSAVPLAGSINAAAKMFSSSENKDVATNQTEQTCTAESGAGAAVTLPGPTRSKQNLMRIRGIDAQTEQALNAIGVTTYEQIAKWGCGEINTAGRSVAGAAGRIQREIWTVQARILADGGSTSFSRAFDAANPPAPSDVQPALSLVKDGKWWCVTEEHSVAVKAVRAGRELDTAAMSTVAKPIWIDEVSKKYGPDWANWQTFGSTTCMGDDCSMSARVCRARAMECQQTAVDVTYSFELSNGLSEGATSAITAEVLDDLKKQWTTAVHKKSGAEWLSGKEISELAPPNEAACAQGAQPNARLQYQCTFSAVPCKDVGPPPLPQVN